MDLIKLFETAEKYGNVHIYSSKDMSPPKCYCCTIKFNTINHVELEAKSQWDQTIEESLRQAIKKAVLVVESVQGSISSQDIEETKLLLANQ